MEIWKFKQKFKANSSDLNPVNLTYGEKWSFFFKKFHKIANSTLCRTLNLSYPTDFDH